MIAVAQAAIDGAGLWTEVTFGKGDRRAGGFYSCPCIMQLFYYELWIIY